MKSSTTFLIINRHLECAERERRASYGSVEGACAYVLKVVRWVNRCRFEIIAEILQVAKNGAKKTRIMHSCNLTHGLTREFLTYLLEAGLVRKGNSFSYHRERPTFPSGLSDRKTSFEHRDLEV